MRSYRFAKLESVDDLTLADDRMPEPQRGEVLVRVKAVALNYRDLSAVLGNYVWAVKQGLIPCSDASGEVVAVGEGVTAFRPGDRVISTFHPRWFGGRLPSTAGADSYGTAIDGWLTEYKAVSQEAVIKLPDALSFEEGATLPCAATTAWNALSGSTPVRAGQTVLTLGTGGVSVFAVQLAKAVGATVIAMTSSESKAAKLTALGADEVVVQPYASPWGRQIRAIANGGTGVDCVVEVGGPATVNESLHAVRRGGEVVLIGFLSSENPGIDYFHLKGSGALVRSIGVGDRSVLEDLTRAAAGGKVRPVIDRVFDFQEAKEAFRHLQSGQHIGKIVIRVGD